MWYNKFSWKNKGMPISVRVTDVQQLEQDTSEFFWMLKIPSRYAYIFENRGEVAHIARMFRVVYSVEVYKGMRHSFIRYLKDEYSLTEQDANIICNAWLEILYESDFGIERVIRKRKRDYMVE